MNDLIKPEAPVPMIPMMGDLLPALPVITPNDNFIKRLINRGRMNYLVEMNEQKAKIAESHQRAVNSTMSAMIELMTFSQRCELVLRRMEYERNQMNYNEYIGNQKVQQEVWKTKTMEVEFKTAELTLKQMMKEVEGDSTAQDRED
jgi:hypothetical protein